MCFYDLLKLIYVNLAISINVEESKGSFVVSVWFADEVLVCVEVGQCELAPAPAVGDREQEAILYSFYLVLWESGLACVARPSSG